jgi:hypothetical protein
MVLPDGMLFVELTEVEGMLFMLLSEGMLFMLLPEGMLFMELWHSDRIGNMLDHGFFYFGTLAGKMKGRMESIGCEAVANAS